MRRLIEFACEGETLVGTLDEADGNTGLLIVSGGNEIRCGAHRGMAMLAQRLAAVGVPVFRFDRRGVGDSTGTNAGYTTSRLDIAAALATFKTEAGVNRVIAFGNCDAATALALHGRALGVDALVLANPWTGGEEDDLPGGAAIRARYASKLRNPREWLRLLRGGVNLGRLLGGIRKSVAPSPPPSLAAEIAAGLSSCPATILLAARDNTALVFSDAWRRLGERPRVRIETLDSASHSFAGERAADWLFAQLLQAVEAPRLP